MQFSIKSAHWSRFGWSNLNEVESSIISRSYKLEVFIIRRFISILHCLIPRFIFNASYSVPTFEDEYRIVQPRNQRDMGGRGCPYSTDHATMRLYSCTQHHKVGFSFENRFNYSVFRVNLGNMPQVWSRKRKCRTGQLDDSCLWPSGCTCHF